MPNAPPKPLSSPYSGCSGLWPINLLILLEIRIKVDSLTLLPLGSVSMQDKANRERVDIDPRYLVRNKIMFQLLRHCLSYANTAVIVEYLFLFEALGHAVSAAWKLERTPHAITSSCTSSGESKVSRQHPADHWAIPHPTQTTDG
ncbi:uncharacterized protein FFB20_00431 [Fusarium fujikuroi]|nr:uncharacterized protein FFB20_00431 [Fusarium fujikuroi]SCN73455.1 uncharacterized protein FFE2_02855 [Fusarium fujikuroi]SCN88462.1 uncharacterized protein FFM5_04418 [Fusarium fujikuroi]SCO04734.1 uncharacterized protein FFC1_09734 [Fusarium fujikuroi]SCO36040.1 uncharacterized protein FFNC_05006 [Fusarium fujikuroi]